MKNYPNSLLLLCFCFVFWSCQHQKSTSKTDTETSVTMELEGGEKKEKNIPKSPPKEAKDTMAPITTLTAKQLLQKRFKSYHVRKMFSSHTNEMFSLTSKETLLEEKLIFFDLSKKEISKEILLDQYNPYKKYLSKNSEYIHEQLIGNNQVVNSTKDKIKGKIPDILFKYLPNDYVISAIHHNIYTHIRYRNDFMILKFGIDALPGDEILEHITYPGISSFVILDTLGNLIASVNDLPFVTSDWSISADAKYLIVTHLQRIDDPKFSTRNEDWVHGVSVINLKTKKICHTEYDLDEIFTGFSTTSGYPYYHVYKEGHGSGNLIEHLLIKNSLFKAEYPVSLKERGKDGVRFKKDNSFLRYDTDFQSSKLKCN